MGADPSATPNEVPLCACNLKETITLTLTSPQTLLLESRVSIEYNPPLFIASGDPHPNIVAIRLLNAHCVVIIISRWLSPAPVRINDSTPSSIDIVFDVSIVDIDPVHDTAVVTSGLDAVVVLLVIFV